jgi:hypothetical protein
MLSERVIELLNEALAARLNFFKHSNIIQYRTERCIITPYYALGLWRQKYMC